MSRKPIDKTQPTECRQAIWDEIRNRGEAALFSITEIAKCVLLEQSSVHEYMTGLINAGYLGIHTLRSSAKGGNILFLKKNTGIEAPRVRKDGTQVTMGQGRRQMWNAMQVLKEFSPRDLAFNASTELHTVAESEAKTYCAALCAAGYLVGRAGGRYNLITSMWTGPYPPQIQRTKQVYDPNLRKIVWRRIEGGAE
ncbi:hypothetical protein KI809_15530 [Geobacter pelophilus]|uniref:Uncharacterized protein n=1 Tax=Geoanaerobacter pelophilus TaxID=60036 RepID=A0AAW4L852_9BACT|nr:hypothetical protein [Geoanaerobacter pelophilus]MBT0665720.1 hypothetical protein [Geoanaerobacter pelophilus]